MLKNLGMGTWRLGEGSKEKYQQEVATLRYGLNQGITLIDTAEMYGQGAAESLVGEAIQPFVRTNLTIVSKFYPWHANAQKLRTSLAASLKRLQTDYLDLYLLHWRQDTNLAEIVKKFRESKTRRINSPMGCFKFRCS